MYDSSYIFAFFATFFLYRSLQPLLFIIIIYVNCLIDIAIWYTIYKEVKGDFYVRKISLGKIY